MGYLRTRTPGVKILRTKEEINILKTWAEAHREELQYKGILRGSIILAWRDAHSHLQPVAVRQYRTSFGVGHTVARAVDVFCYYCARHHVYKLEPGVRVSPYTSQDIQCSVSCKGNLKGFTFIDELPLMDWERELYGQQ